MSKVLKIEEMKLKENFRNFTNLQFVPMIEHLMGTRDMCLKILKAHAGELKPDYDEEDLEGLTQEEIAVLVYEDDLDQIDWAKFNGNIQAMDTEIYFPLGSISTLALSSFERYKTILSNISQKISLGAEINFDKNVSGDSFKKQLERVAADVNYSVCSILDIFGMYQGRIYVALKDYFIKRNIDVNAVVEEYLDYYRAHRPALPLFVKYPELAAIIESQVEPEYFQVLVELSSLLSREQVEGIASQTLKVDEQFINDLQEAARDVMSIKAGEDL